MLVLSSPDQVVCMHPIPRIDTTELKDRLSVKNAKEY